MAEANCMNCGDSFEPEHSRSDNVCNFCNPPKQPIIESSKSEEIQSEAECAECGAELYEFFHGDNQLCEVCGGY